MNSRLQFVLLSVLPLLIATGCQPAALAATQAPAPRAEVQLDVFSGRPNPQWTLSGEQASQLAAQLATLPEAPAAEPPGQLGYRGFLVSLVDGTTGAVTHAQVYSGTVWLTVGDVTAYRGDPGRSVERWLLETADQSQASEELLQMVREALGGQR